MNSFPFVMHAAPFPLPSCLCSLQRLQNSKICLCFCCLIMIRSSDGRLAPVEVKHTQQGSCDLLNRAVCVCVCVLCFLKMWFLLLRVWVSELLF